ncbi:MAG: hypothetical protein EBS78_10970 [Altererythrobacter sp.]|jgi:hypothetical protein|nr:hypothetical protein [Altererythrobacter sp.]
MNNASIESYGIATSAMLVELSISCWTGRKLDKRVSEEVDAAKNTRVKAGNYHKHLMAGCTALDAVLKYAANVRLWNTRETLPWSDAGPRLITMESFMAYKAKLNEHEETFKRYVDIFLQAYPTMVSAAAFQLGDLFNRDDYPTVDEIAKKFRFAYTFSPVPVAGDFRIDIAEQAKAELVEQYEKQFQSRINNAMRDLWERLHECLTHMSERLANEDDGTRKKFHKTLVSNAAELVALLQRMNIAQDPQLESARRQLADALIGVDSDTLKDVDTVRANVKQRVDTILNTFDW